MKFKPAWWLIFYLFPSSTSHRCWVSSDLFFYEPNTFRNWVNIALHNFHSFKSLSFLLSHPFHDFLSIYIDLLGRLIVSCPFCLCLLEWNSSNCFPWFCAPEILTFNMIVIIRDYFFFISLKFSCLLPCSGDGIFSILH